MDTVVTVEGVVFLLERFRLKGVFSLRSIAVMGVMAAIAAVLGRLSIYITPTFKAISFAYLPGAVVSMMFGPWAALAFGFVSDLVTYFANPQGAYFIGYAISNMFDCFVYAVFLHKRPVTFLRVLGARAVILVFSILGMGYIWMSMMYGTSPAGFFSGARLINNLVQLPVHAALITIIGKKIQKNT